MADIKCYRDLLVWQKSMVLAERCYRATNTFPRSELYGLTSQIRRAAVSIPSNIAEGHNRRSRAALHNHLSIALGSQAELETQIELAMRMQLLTEATAHELLDLAAEVGKMLGGSHARWRARLPLVPSP